MFCYIILFLNILNCVKKNLQMNFKQVIMTLFHYIFILFLFHSLFMKYKYFFVRFQYLMVVLSSWMERFENLFLRMINYNDVHILYNFLQVNVPLTIFWKIMIFPRYKHYYVTYRWSGGLILFPKGIFA